MYDTFVYTAFLRIRNRQILLEDIVDIERSEITRLLIALWDILCRAIEKYNLYFDIMVSAEKKYLMPAFRKLDIFLTPLIGTRFEERMRGVISDIFELFPDYLGLSILRTEDRAFH